MKQHCGFVCFYVACYQGQLQVVQCLIEKGANIETKDKDQETPLFIVSCYGKTDIVKYLISKGANKNSKNSNGKTPYDVACDWTSNKSQKDIIKELLK